jgi:hypothetical protein
MESVKPNACANREIGGGPVEMSLGHVAAAEIEGIGISKDPGNTAWDGIHI